MKIELIQKDDPRLKVSCEEVVDFENNRNRKFCRDFKEYG